MRILVTGSSGSGTTTLGRALAQHFGVESLDADDYYWLRTEPPFQEKREPAQRISLLLEDLERVPSAAVAGSVMEWGTELEEGFTLIVFLTLDAEIRVARLRERELARYGRVDEAFLAWLRSTRSAGCLAATAHVTKVAEVTAPIAQGLSDGTRSGRATKISIGMRSL
jgi:adenylate kinase family enzyme